MTQDDAELILIAEMRQRLPRLPYRRCNAGIDYYFELRRERRELFDFRYRGSQWALVRSWLLRHGLVVPSDRKAWINAWRASAA
jgi:hypothetical protein